MSIKSYLSGIIQSVRNPAEDFPGEGIYHFLRETPPEKTRVHLRIDADGSGVLLINASRMLHLNPTAARMAYSFLQYQSEEQTLQALQRDFHIQSNQFHADYDLFIRQMNELIRPDGACPVHEMDLDIIAPFSSQPSAPYRMDLALTYRCNNNCVHCYNDRSRAGTELSTAQWFQVLDHLWQIGIPHIIFTGGEPTLRDDLPDLIRHAESNGQITGLNTNARRLKDSAFLQKLVDSGLDHVQITVESHDPQIHDRMVNYAGAWDQTIAGLKNVLASSLYVMTNTTLLRQNCAELEPTLRFLNQLGVPTIGLNALIYSGKGRQVGDGLDEAELEPLLKIAREHTAQTGQRLIWYSPTEYCRFDPVLLDLGVKGCTAALYNMCIEPDGNVIPCQSYYQAVGNILVDPWDAIWKNDLCVSLRERKNVPEKCNSCNLLSECGGGCPLTRQVKTTASKSSF